MKKISLKNSKLKAFVDDEYYEKVKNYVWSLSIDGYPRATIEGERYFLHRFIMKDFFNIKGFEIDHINRNPLDNTKNNLRIATRRQNAANSKKKKDCSSLYKGVKYCSTEKRRKRWLASCEYNSKQIYLGRYLTEKEAAIAYNKKAHELWGDYANLNIGLNQTR